MVDVSAKPATVRRAIASGRVKLKPEVLDALLPSPDREGAGSKPSRDRKGAGSLLPPLPCPKGEAISTARIAGIAAAKRTADWIPLCHPLPLDWVHLEFARTAPDELLIICTAKTTARTGVEMEALVGVSAAALTIYDMAKAADKSIVIGPVQLERKTGGKSGTYARRE